MYQPKVSNTQKYENSQGSHVVTTGKLILVPSKYEEVSKIVESRESLEFLDWCQIKSNPVLPIIISETEEIEEGDWFYHEYTNTIAKASNTSLNNIFTSLEDGKSNYIRSGCVKILALPKHFSDKHLQAIVDGKMEDGDKVLVKCDSIQGFYDRVPGDLNYGVETYTKGYKVHLDQQDHITLFPAKQSLEEFIKGWMNENPPYKTQGDYVYKAMKATAKWAKKNNY